MPPSDKDHIVVVAAGRGKRMGLPKALMPVGGRPWWRHQHERLGTLERDTTWVVSCEVRREIELVAGAPRRCLIGDAAAPMFASVLVGLESLKSDPPRGVFILPVDVPAPGPTIWQALAAAKTVAVPTHRGKRGHPVYLPWTVVERKVLDAGAGGRDLRLDDLIRPIAREIEVDDAAVATNLNTPADVRAWLEHTAAP